MQQLRMQALMRESDIPAVELNFISVPVQIYAGENADGSPLPIPALRFV